MKDITFAVPCYNSQDYMKRCIESLLPCGKRGEILIIDDGSTDLTGEIADAYARGNPETVRVIHKANGGHGSGINAALKQAEGRFFKVVDSDDWLDEDALEDLLVCIEEKQDTVDLIVCNYIYDHLLENKTKRVRFANIFPKGRLCGWQDMRPFAPSQYLVMHALVFRTAVLRESEVLLPEHTFYVDNLFACKPLPFVTTIQYLNVDLYHYFLGREDQSVNTENYKKRIDQQILVTKLVLDEYLRDNVEEQHRKLKRYLLRNLSVMLAISSLHLLMIGTKEALQKRRDLWLYVRERDESLYRKLRYGTLSGLTDLPGRLGSGLTIGGYTLAKSIWQFS